MRQYNSRIGRELCVVLAGGIGSGTNVVLSECEQINCGLYWDYYWVTNYDRGRVPQACGGYLAPPQPTYTPPPAPTNGEQFRIVNLFNKNLGMDVNGGSAANQTKPKYSTILLTMALPKNGVGILIRTKSKP